LRRALALLAIIALCPAASFSGNFTVFGPQTYTRGSGKTVTITSTFQIANPSDPYRLIVTNSGITNGTISVNGRKVLTKADFSSSPTGVISRPMSVHAGSNKIAVQLVSPIGASLFVEIVGVENVAPVITATASPAPNGSGWNSSTVTVSFTCSDADSGIATCPAPVVVSAEGAGQVMTGTATDKAGNSKTASVTLNIDKTAPVVSATRAPAANGSGWNNSPVTVTFSATDVLSGVTPGSVSSPVTRSTDGANQSATGQATDLAGNVGTVTETGINIDQSVPTIAVGLTPAANANGWNDTPVTGHFTCSDSGSGIAVCPPDQIVATDGANQTVSGTATDLAGNTASITSTPFNIDATKPSISIAFTPPPNASGWNKTPVTAHFTCADAGSGIAVCPPDQTIGAEGANQTVSGTATDRAGNTNTASTVVSVDTTAPVVTVTSPINGATVTTSPVTVTGTAADALSGVANATCNGVPATVTASILSCMAPLVPGPNSIDVVATDVADNSSTSTLNVVLQTSVPGPKVTITAPVALSYFNITPTTVTGTVDDPNATVTVNSIPAAGANGSFSVALPLAEGPNIITASASNANGVGTASIEVTLDTTPPHVTLTSPQDGFVTTDTAISAAGIVNDIVVGTVNDQQAQVTVNSAAAQVANRTFLAPDLPLSLGLNVIQAVATDRVGNSATTQIKVTRVTPSAQPRIQLTSGNNQFGTIGSVLSAPLVVALADAAGNPVPNKPVIFKVTQNDGMVSAGGTAAPSAVATTDTNGKAQVQWTLGMRAGAGSNTVEAYAVGFGGTAVFTASGALGAAGKIVIDTGNNQIGAIGGPLPKPFIAVVVDDGNNRLAGVAVTFAVQQGGGSFGGQSTVTVNSDSDGRVAAILTLGLQEGNENNVVSADFASNQGLASAFTASGRAPGDQAGTTISGVVLDNSNAPIPGVTMRALLTNVAHSNAAAVQSVPAVQTDTQGQFTISQAPVGFVKLISDGSTVQLTGSYPSLEYDLVTVAGQNTTVGQPIYLLPLSTANQLCVTPATGGGTLTIPEAPGFSLTFGPGQVTFPGGSKTGCVSVTIVHGDKVPMMPGFGQQPRFIVTIQPAGAIFNPPAPITLPNVDGLKPREVTEMYSFDHDIGSFVAIGTGVVSDDGQVIRSSQGVGVLKAGWHCGGNPTQTGTGATCPECQTCIGVQCTRDPNQNGNQCGGNFCKICKNGICGKAPPSGTGPFSVDSPGPGVLETTFKVFLNPLLCSFTGDTIVETVFFQNNSCTSNVLKVISAVLPGNYYTDTIGLAFIPTQSCQATASQQILWIDPDTGVGVPIANHSITYTATVTATSVTGTSCLQGLCNPVTVPRP